MSDIEDRILQLLLTVAPEAADQELARDVDLREQLDLDSMDHLRFLTAISEAFGIDIPEKVSADLVTLERCARYVEERGPARG